MWVSNGFIQNVIRYSTRDAGKNGRRNHPISHSAVGVDHRKVDQTKTAISAPALRLAEPSPHRQSNLQQSIHGLDHKSIRQRSGLFAKNVVVTRNGPKLVRDLREGMAVLTRDRGFQKIVAVKRLKQEHGVFEFAQIPAHHFAKNIPERDVLIAKNHGVIAPSLHGSCGLTKGSDLSDLTVKRARDRVFRIYFESHELILVDGIWVESSLSGKLYSGQENADRPDSQDFMYGFGDVMKPEPDDALGVVYLNKVARIKT